MSSRRAWWTSRMELDLRSLAVLRIGLALGALADLATRAPDLGAHYTDRGTMPRAALLGEYGGYLKDSISLHVATGSLGGEALLFAVAAAFGVALLVGWQPRFACAGLWLLTSSLQLRNPFVGYGADALLRMMLLWSCFLPLGAGGQEPPGRSSGAPSTIAAMAWTVQVFLVFFVAGWSKLSASTWQNGDGVAAALGQELLARGPGIALRSYPELCRLLSVAVPWSEIAVAVLLVSPVATALCRSAAFVLGTVLMVGFGTTLHVGIFPWLGIVALTPFLPGSLWDRWAPAPSPSSFDSDPYRPLRDVVVVVLLAAVVSWNLGLVVPAVAQWTDALRPVIRLAHLEQQWGMFADPSSARGLLTATGRLRDQRFVDLLAAGGPLPDQIVPSTGGPPAAGTIGARSTRWRAMWLQLAGSPDNTGQLRAYGRYFCREWNRRSEGATQLLGLELVWWTRSPPGSTGVADAGGARSLLWTHDCFG